MNSLRIATTRTLGPQSTLLSRLRPTYTRHLHATPIHLARRSRLRPSHPEPETEGDPEPSGALAVPTKREIFQTLDEAVSKAEDLLFVSKRRRDKLAARAAQKRDEEQEWEMSGSSSDEEDSPSSGRDSTRKPRPDPRGFAPPERKEDSAYYTTSEDDAFLNANKLVTPKHQPSSSIPPLTPTPETPDSLLDPTLDARRASSQQEDDWYINTAYNLPSSTPPLPRWMRTASVADARAEGREVDATQQKTGPLELEEIVGVLKEERGRNLCVIDMRSKCDFTDFMVICEGVSAKQVYALVDAVRRRAKFRIPYDTSLPPNVRVEGADTEDWMTLDTGKYIIHAFTPEARERYNLEGLWTAIKDPLLALTRQPELANTHGGAEEEAALRAARLSWGSHPVGGRERLTKSVVPREEGVEDGR
ncbi:Mitochondrial assembly of ribosomal large subunit protein 1 [Rhizophlyctis rosea]|nr:Mitochondrial assembly of ribosomal large subunit protein 1 [Rhizophlyctis rosea]